LHQSDLLRHLAIGRACITHKLPAEGCFPQVDDPWERTERISDYCAEHDISLALNDTTIIGNHIADGDKSKFWQKAIPALFEQVCLIRWPKMVAGAGIVLDAWMDGRRVDFKCKHRNVSPNKKYIATVPVAQRKQEVEYYCFGQIAAGMTEGFIVGVMSKRDFQAACRTKQAGDVDDNGERYVTPVDYVTHRWRWDSDGSFWPAQYERDIQ
jgi:hypothetical protein